MVSIMHYHNCVSAYVSTEDNNDIVNIKAATCNCIVRRVAEIQFFEKTYLIVIKHETCLELKMNHSTLFLIGSYAQKLVASY